MDAQTLAIVSGVILLVVLRLAAWRRRHDGVGK